MNTLAYDSAYWDGHAGRMYTGGSYSSYLQGQNHGGHNGGGGGAAGGGIGILMVFGFMLALLVIAALVAVWAALTAMVGALVLMAFVRVWQPALLLPFPRAFRACFRGMLVYMLTTSAVVGACWLLLYNGVGHKLAEQITAALKEVGQAAGRDIGHRRNFTITNALAAFVSNAGGHTGFFLGVLGVLWGPGLLAAAGVFMRHVPEVFSGLRGYLKAVASATVVLVPAMLFTNWLIAVLAERSQLAHMPTTTLKAAALVATFALLAYALIGGLLAAALIYLVMRLWLGKGHVGLGRSYNAAVWGFLGYGLTTALALYFFRHGDPFMWWVHDVVMAPDPLATAMAQLHRLPGALWNFLPLQLPGLLVCGASITTSIRGPFDSVVGYLKACAFGGAIALFFLLPFLGLAVLGMATRVPS